MISLEKGFVLLKIKENRKRKENKYKISLEENKAYISEPFLN